MPISIMVIALSPDVAHQRDYYHRRKWTRHFGKINVTTGGALHKFICNIYRQPFLTLPGCNAGKKNVSISVLNFEIFLQRIRGMSVSFISLQTHMI